MNEFSYATRRPVNCFFLPPMRPTAVAFALLCGLAAEAQEAWESVNLELAVKGSRVLELTEESLPVAAREHPLLVVWF